MDGRWPMGWMLYLNLMGRKPDSEWCEHVQYEGNSLVKKVNALPDYKFTPILVLTTEAGEAMKAEGKAWLVKPFHPKVLLSAITKLAWYRWLPK
jgi:CheY-like chemotaxis protein